jgi:hypothetical protein
MATTPASSAPPALAADRARTRSPWLRALQTFGLFAYYLAILIVLLWIYGRGNAPAAPFIYQGF